MTFTLAHFSDPHIGPLPQPTFGELLSKRITGYLNYRRNRKASMTSGSLDLLLADLKAQNPDHIALTGDVVNIALEREFVQAADWLEAVGPADHVSLIPGNHDAYVPSALAMAKKHWGPYFLGDEAVSDRIEFPYVRKRGVVKIIALSTGVPTAPFMATGRLGREQISKAETLLKAAAEEDCFRVVMIHHPPFVEEGRWYKRLTDYEAFNEMIARAGAELVLHGHTHRRNVMYLDGPTGNVPVVGVPSAASGLEGKHEPGRYNLYKIDAVDGAEDRNKWRCEQIERGITSNGIEELARRVL
ncbi:MAG: metallophosphoesterase [Hyphomicrobiales bacterium]